MRPTDEVDAVEVAMVPEAERQPAKEESEGLRAFQPPARDKHGESRAHCDRGLRGRGEGGRSDSSKRPLLMRHCSQDSLEPLFFEGKPLPLYIDISRDEL